jgi:tetratricopeptide (TPR) repeat protein
LVGTEEANKELEAALTSDPQNLMLLAGASYWLAAHKNSEKALELAQKAVQLEPRYTWSQIALARALSGQKQPLEAERAMRFAAQYGKFPTLDYELATTLASMGLYDEAADVLLNSFSYKQGQIETLLAGRVAARADSFTELLGPERRASIFQFAGAGKRGRGLDDESASRFRRCHSAAGTRSTRRVDSISDCEGVCRRQRCDAGLPGVICGESTGAPRHSVVHGS